MSNIFEYKPQLQYILQDINSIDNVKDPRIESMKTYIINSAVPVIVKVTEIRQVLEDIKVSIDRKLENVAIPFNTALLDDVIREKLSGLTDSSRLINDGIITYPLYKEVKDNPILASIEDSWDEYHCGINGTVEAEIEPYVYVVEDILNNISILLNDIILYEEEPQARADITKLKESELLQIEKYLRIQDELEVATEQGDRAKYISLKKQFDIVENTLRYRKNINLILTDILSKMMSVVQTMYDGTISEFHTIQYNALNEQLSTIKRNVGVSDLALCTVIMSAFMGQYADTINLKRNYKNVSDKNVRGRTFGRTVTDARLYKDVAVPSIVEFTYVDDALSMKQTESTIISGLEGMTKSYRQSILMTKNMLESDAVTVNNLLDNIYEKYRTRTMYKLMGR